MIEPKQSPNFNKDFFLSMVNRCSELDRLDFKEEYYSFSDETQTLKFVKHIIAMANTARRIGASCWILFGVKDESKEIVDIREKYPGKKVPSGIRNPNNPKFEFYTMMTCDYTQKFINCMLEWITPDAPYFDFDYGFADGKFVSYLTIHPKYTSEPFQLKKNYGKYAIGTAFVRQNDSTVEVPSSEKKYILSKADVEYIPEKDWKNLINFYRTGDFQKQHELVPWVMPGLNGYQDDNVLGDVLGTLISEDKHIILVGNRGEGKTVFLYRLAYYIALLHNVEAPCMRSDLSIIDYLNPTPEKPIPLFFSLRTSFSSTKDIQELIGNQLAETLGRKKSSIELDKCWRIPNSNWIVMLDGVDELQTEDSGAYLNTWISKLPENVKVIMTSRPYAVPNPFETFKIVAVKPIPREQVLEIIRHKMIDHSEDFEMYEEDIETIIGRIFGWIESNFEIYSFLENFRSLEGFLGTIIPNYFQEKPLEDARQEYVEDQKNIEVPISNQEVSPSELAMAEDLANLYEHETPDINFVIADEALKEKYMFPPLVDVLEEIIDFLEKDEKNRSKKFGKTCSGEQAEKSRHSLRKLAWFIPWHELDFDAEESDCWIKEPELTWNKNIGYVLKKIYPNFSFVNYLSRRYFSAEYAWKKKNFPHEKIIARYLEQSDIRSARAVISLLNEHLLENGRDPVIIERSSHNEC